jgi:hypothetical protein
MSAEPRRVLVRAPNWIGDVVLSLAALRDVRRNFPDARIEVLARPGVAELYGAVGEVDAVRRSRGVAADAAAIRDGFDVAILLYRVNAGKETRELALADAKAALTLLKKHGGEFGLSTKKIGVMGFSAGGHLALTTGMIPMSAGLDRQCPGKDLPKVTAIVFHAIGLSPPPGASRLKLSSEALAGST